VRPALDHLVDPLAGDAVRRPAIGGAAGGDEAEAALEQSCATGSTRALSGSRTEMKALPGRRLDVGGFLARANAAPKLRPTPITSPVERISGPRIGSTFWNLANGNTASLTE
jgi:hypothetical protein